VINSGLVRLGCERTGMYSAIVQRSAAQCSAVQCSAESRRATHPPPLAAQMPGCERAVSYMHACQRDS
jgi:hypothetical protein